MRVDTDGNPDDRKLVQMRCAPFSCEGMATYRLLVDSDRVLVWDGNLYESNHSLSGAEIARARKLATTEGTTLILERLGCFGKYAMLHHMSPSAYYAFMFGCEV